MPTDYSFFKMLFVQVLFSVPWAVASEVVAAEEDDGQGQGLAIGVLNIAIVVPQVFNLLPWQLDRQAVC